jgi:hypothetical protein
MKTLISIFFCLVLSFSALGQDVAVSYEILPQDENQAVTQVYLQSLTDQDQTIRAINLSLALPEGCARVVDQNTAFAEAWTEFLQEVKVNDEVDLSYNNWHYSHRWQYGNADPGMPNTAPVLAPAQGNPPLQIMQIKLEGTCTDKVYLEEQAENQVNQIGDEKISPIEWTVIHPRTELELAPGQRLEIFPNPVVNTLQVKTVGQHDFPYHVELFTVDGKSIFRSNLSDTDALQIDMTTMPAAVYMLSITQLNKTEAVVVNTKILKK